MEDRSLLEKISLFLSCLLFPGLILCLILDMYLNFKVHEYIKYHENEYILHKYCSRIYDYYVCSDDYVISID